jgi:aryl-alcohol dehydrogenase-like predicted oxidoreductase
MVGEIGLGCWQFGGDFGPMDEGTAMAIMACAVDGGADFFDTADVYGAGLSEDLIGRFLRSGERRVTVATKFGRGADVYPDAYTQDRLRRSVEGALRRLGAQRLDLLQLHCVPGAVLREGRVFDWLRRLKDEGTITHFGASVESVEEGLACLEQDGLLSLQVIFNVLRQRMAAELLPEAAARGVGIIVRLPLASGLLAGRYTKQTRFPETDHRSFSRDGQCFNVGETFAGLPFEKGVELSQRLEGYSPQGLSLAGMSLR